MKNLQLNLAFYNSDKLGLFEKFLDFKLGEAGGIRFNASEIEVQDGKEFSLTFYNVFDVYMFGYAWANEQNYAKQ